MKTMFSGRGRIRAPWQIIALEKNTSPRRYGADNSSMLHTLTTSFTPDSTKFKTSSQMTLSAT